MKKFKLIFIAVIASVILLYGADGVQGAANSPTSPAPDVTDQITHNRGNISTTVQNYGYIGGYSWAGRPSGRWPANSERDYLAEMLFWVGGISSADDTLVSNAEDDFNPLPNWEGAEYPTDIILSTDTTSYSYDPTDTIGAGIGFPAYGWRVWDSDVEDWEYNQIYHSLTTSFQPGGPVSVQESICRYSDDASGYPVMGLAMTQTVRQWNYIYNRDMVFITYEITNVSEEDYHEFCFGLYCDFDVGGTDEATGENGRLGDLVGVDTDLDLAWTYDEDGYDPGWGHDVLTGYMGTVLLSTPGDIGMTAFNTDDWDNYPYYDEQKFEIMNNTDIDESLPPTDQYYVQSVRGIDLPAGETVRFDFALVASMTEEGLKEVAQTAKSLYEANYIAARPPDEAVSLGTAGENRTAIKWDETAENSVDPTTGTSGFKGYRIYRSTDLGVSWGTLKQNPDGSTGPGYIPRAQFEVDELGRVPHTFVEENLINGMEYWYAVVAYDSGSVELGIDELETAYSSETPTTATSLITVIPRDNASDYQSPQASIEHTYLGEAATISVPDALSVYVVDDAGVTGDDYRVTLSGDCISPTWSLTDLTTDEVVLSDQTELGGEYYNYPVADGLQVVVTNTSRALPDTSYQSGFASSGIETLEADVVEFADVYGCNCNFRCDYEIRFTETGSNCYDYFSAWYDLEEYPITANFEVWNTTTNTQVDAMVVDWYGDGEFTMADEDYIIIVNDPYSNGTLIDALPDDVCWLMVFYYTSTPDYGDIFKIEGVEVLTVDDQFDFSSDKTVASQASENLDKIHVVPNPYLAHAEWELYENQRKIQFVNLPGECTIRIYTLAGDLVSTLDHNDGTGSHDWNLLTRSGRSLVSGVYLYNVESPYGNYTGKFAVIK